jgi:hypothetical protein
MDAELLDFGRTGLDSSLIYDDPPRADAPYEERAEWSAHYVGWIVGTVPLEGQLPKDVRPTQRYEVEFNSCVADPDAYVRAMASELSDAALS